MSDLVEHAKRELEIIGEDNWMKNGVLKIVETFAEMGHSGGSAEVAIPVITQLLLQQNLSPLTNDSSEWEFHPNEKYGLAEDAWNNGKGGVWQNIRNSEAFSNDAGLTYWLIHETVNTAHPTKFYASRNRRNHG